MKVREGIGSVVIVWAEIDDDIDEEVTIRGTLVGGIIDLGRCDRLGQRLRNRVTGFPSNRVPATMRWRDCRNRQRDAQSR